MSVTIEMSEKRFERLIEIINEANRAQQAFANANVVNEPDEVSNSLYEATYELCHHLTQIVTSV